MKRFNYILSILCFIFITSLSAQIKNEKETRISKSDFPKTALDLLEKLPKQYKKIKYYKETDSLKVSFEAKVKIKKRLYSIEFNNKGLLEDIEVLVKKKHLKKTHLSRITDYLNETYRKSSILKIQKQYLNTSQNSVKKTLENALDDASECNYEIIVEVKKKKRYQLKELTFDKKGYFISERTLKSSSYEHILY